MATQILIESLDLTEAQPQPDTRVLRGVVLIRAGMSKNRRFYGENVLRDSASIFEGAKAYVNHPARAKEARSIRDISGWYSGVRFENGALRADRHFTKNQAGQDVWAIAEEIVGGRAPASLAGLSINAVGQGSMARFDDGDALNVESITAAISVDDVSEAAAGGSYLLTASADDDLTANLLNALTFEEWAAAKPEFIARIHDQWSAEFENELQEAMARLEQERDAAIEEAEIFERALEIERLMSQVNLPAAWAKMLREQLAAAEPAGWAAIIEAEREKARSAGHRIAIHSASQQVQKPLVTHIPRRRAPLDITAMRAPEELAALVREIKEERLWDEG